MISPSSAEISELQGWDLVTRAMAFLTLLLLPLACAVPGSATLPTEIEPLGATDAIDFHEQADRHEEHDEHDEHDDHEKREDAKVEKSPAPAQHWWDRFWPFVLPATPTRSDVADAVQLDEHAHHREHEDQKGTVHSEPGHWWDHLWPFAMSAQEEAQTSQLLADEQEEHVEDEDRKGHKLHTPESHWWDHLWPFVMMTAAFPAIGVYAFKRAQSAMQQPLLEEAQTVV